MRGLWLACAWVVGCGAPAAGVSVPPPQPPSASACAAPSDHESPLVVDLSVEDRADLEAAMTKGIAVVSYDCHGLRVLPDCHVDGRYSFIGVTEKEDVLHLSSQADVTANLSMSSARAPLDLALALVGRKVASRSNVTQSIATGDCKRATHFVRAANVGAFALRSAPKPMDVASAFAPAAAGAAMDRRDGSLEACRGAAAGGDAAPSRCGTAIRLDLRAIGEAKSTAEDSEPRCRKPLVTLDNGQCGDAASAAPHLCAPDDLDDCRAQCEKGSMASCAILGRSYQLGRGVPADVARAKDLLGKACNGGSAQGCGRLGEIAIAEKNGAEAARLLQRSCNMGWLEACDVLGGLLAQTPGGGGDAFTILKRSCDGGDPEGCWTLGKLFEAGLGVRQNDAEALKLYELACDGGARRGCLTLSTFVEKGRGGVSPDPKRAIALLQSSCDRGFSDACGFLSMRYFEGKGVDRDPQKGLALLERACQGDDLGSCLPLAMRYENGVGVAKDEARARQLYTRACDGGIALACEQIRKK